MSIKINSLSEKEVKDRKWDVEYIKNWYWVEHTKAWAIPGTEDLRPYIPRKTKTVKWLITIVGNPIIAAVLAGIMMVVL